MKITADRQRSVLTVYVPDTRAVEVSRFGIGNLKIGLNVYTYSRLPGRDGGTCPGSTPECEAVCYAKRVVAEAGIVSSVWALNSQTEDAPESLPDGCRLLRLHISGDFTSVPYINGWTELLARHPDVTVWAYTRSWRVPSLLPALERLRALPNVQMFASMDETTPELPPTGWRRAWIDGDTRAQRDPVLDQYTSRVTFDGTRTLVCPEQTGLKADCATCRYCFDGQRGDVTFLKH